MQRCQAKSFFDVLICLGGCFHEVDIICLCEALSFFVAHVPSCVPVAFIPDEEDFHFLVSLLAGLFEPTVDVLKALTTSDIVNHHAYSGAPII